MQAHYRTDAGLRGWTAFLAAAIAVCLAFGALGLTSGIAFAAPDGSSSSSAESKAADTEKKADDADAKADAADTATGSYSGALPVGNDLFLSLGTVNSTGETVKANLFVAGQNVSVDKATIGADAFVAGQDVAISGMKSKNNVFAAGNNVTVSGTSAVALFAAGNNLDIAADAKEAHLVGRTVFLKGTFEGDVTISAQTVVVDPYVVVKGKLAVSSESEPSIASTAKIGTYEFTQVQSNQTSSLTSSFSDIGSPAWIMSLIFTMIFVLVVGILMLLALRTETIDASGNLVRDRPVAILVTGLLSVILVPVLCILLLITIIGIPVSFVLMLVMVVIAIFADVYTAIALGRAAMGKVNKWISSILFLLIFGALLSLPIVNYVVSVLCIIFATGSAVQGWWVWRRGKSLRGSDDYVDPNDFNVPRGSHYAPSVAPASYTVPVYTPSGMQVSGTGSIPPINQTPSAYGQDSTSSDQNPSTTATGQYPPTTPTA